jgi:D-3-phosphoglycerate dehydrogenase / 2-oxoglutarate reductase
MTRVLISPTTLAGVQASFVDVLKAEGFELVFHGHKSQLDEAKIIEALKGIDATLAGSEPYNERVFAASPQLKVVARVGVGYDAVDLAAATRHGVVVATTPNTNQGAVAEHTFAMMLALTKNLVSQHVGTREGRWPRGSNIPIRWRTMGIAGLGRIGKAMATRAKAFEMKVIAHDPFPDTAWAAANDVKLVSLEELFRESDFLTLHMPALPETTKMVNAKMLALMKPTAYLINTSRGAVIDEADLYEALKAKRIAGAGLDVFAQEPPGNSPLLTLDNVVLTPHAAGVDLQSRDDMARSAADAIISLSRGEWPTEKVVNPQVRATFRWK